eukprot:1098293-Amphidinium_carterae.1
MVLVCYSADCCLKWLPCRLEILVIVVYLRIVQGRRTATVFIITVYVIISMFTATEILCCDQVIVILRDWHGDDHLAFNIAFPMTILALIVDGVRRISTSSKEQ